MSGSVRIKICGVTETQGALACVDAGVDMIGLNFVPESPRRVEVRRAAEIARVVEGRAERVAVFRNPRPGDVDRVLRQVEVERIQLHGEEEEEEVEQLDLPVIKAIRGADTEAAETYPGAILLLDNPSGEAGSGKAWAWHEAGELIAAGYDVILSGGLSPENVGQALADLGDLLPWGVDVASGVESDGNRKDPGRIKAFVEAVRRAEETSE